MRKLYCAAVALILGSLLASGQESKYPPVRVPVQMLVTVASLHGGVAADLAREDVRAIQGDVRIPIANWVPLRGDQAKLDMFVVIDDASSTSLGSNLGDLRQFIHSQPGTTSVGLAYMRNGIATEAHEPTADHGLAAAAFRLPLGDGGALNSPYWSLNDLIKRWMPSGNRRAILMVTSGIDSFGSLVPSSPCVDLDIAGAQRAGIQVFAIYTPGTGRVSLNRWRINFGQLFLSKIAQETGGEAYYLGAGSLVSFEPYLSSITERLGHQYLAPFWVTATGKDELRSIKFWTEIPNAKIVSAARVRVPAW